MRLPKTPKELALAGLIAFASWLGILFQFIDSPAPTWYAVLLVIPIALLAASIVAWVIQIGVRSAKD